ncbi:hypothetical protein FAES_4779 [Fibrella aestuarina BUZ 2]|uniref:Lipoprotein n=1 Tax=Fibrella aestuarina BUZ 2 TaxID=1166018 RepID=I0KF75_9BACT|nr:hypothetical protein [Fibrella aestuarina]CCH02778.1 hypothetical protein FAES_4779 [Fibrella aestuarina BUZ 2]
MRSFLLVVAPLLLLIVACSEGKKAESTAQPPTDSTSTAIYDQVAAESSAIADQLKNAAAEINRQCPIQVDAGTRLDSAHAVSTTELQYFYTLTAVVRADMPMDVAQLEAQTKPMLIESVKTNPAMAELRDHSVTMTYLYRDRTGEFVMRIPVGPTEYGN